MIDAQYIAGRDRTCIYAASHPGRSVCLRQRDKLQRQIEDAIGFSIAQTRQKSSEAIPWGWKMHCGKLSNICAL